MASTAAKYKTDVSEVLNAAVQRKVTPKQEVKEKTFENINANTFFKIVFDEKTTPEEKKQAIIKELTFAGTKEEMRTKLAEYYAVEEYLQNVREEMSKEIIRITDTETFSELKNVYDQMNSSLIEFNDKMSPLTDIIDAIYTLRTQGKTIDVFKEIQNDRNNEKEAVVKQDILRDRLDSINQRMRQINVENSTLEGQKGFLGFGGTKPEAKRKIAENLFTLQEQEKELTQVEDQIKSLKTEEKTSGDFAMEKSKLRELLDISTDEHKERQDQLVQSALEFVRTAKERVGAVKDHLKGMDKQIENLYDANGNMLNVYAILNEGVKGAETDNTKIRDTLATAPESEDIISKLTREQKKQAVEQHIAEMDNAATSTMSTFADLTSQSIRIKTMKDANGQQIQKARTMHSQGVAGIADRLSVVLQAVSSAALGESSAMAKETLSQMALSTNKIAQKESIKVAMGISETNDDLVKAIDDLGAYGEVIKTATDISRKGVQEMRAKLDELSSLAKDVQSDLNDSIGVHATTGRGDVSPSPGVKTTTTEGFKNPFAKV